MKNFTDETVNGLLVKTIKVYKELKVNGQDKLADELLGLSSQVADNMLYFGKLVGSIQPNYTNTNAELIEKSNQLVNVENYKIEEERNYIL